MLRVRPRLFFLFGLSAGWIQAQTIISNFNSGTTDFWTAYANADPHTTIAYSPSGGVGGTGAIVLQEPANGANDYFVAPAKFTGNLSAYYTGTLSFDLMLNPAWDHSSEAAMVILTGTYNNSSLSIGYLPPSNQYPNAASFTTFALNLSTATAWGLTNTSSPIDFVSGTLATDAQIQGILSNLTSIRILGDWTNLQDQDILDNVTLTAVPEPSTYAVLAGLCALGCSMYRRRRRAEI